MHTGGCLYLKFFLRKHPPEYVKYRHSVHAWFEVLEAKVRPALGRVGEQRQSTGCARLNVQYGDT